MGKKCKKKVQWRRLSINELKTADTSASSTTTRRRVRRKTPERGEEDSGWRGDLPDHKAPHTTTPEANARPEQGAEPGTKADHTSKAGLPLQQNSDAVTADNSCNGSSDQNKKGGESIAVVAVTNYPEHTGTNARHSNGYAGPGINSSGRYYNNTDEFSNYNNHTNNVTRRQNHFFDKRFVHNHNSHNFTNGVVCNNVTQHNNYNSNFNVAYNGNRNGPMERPYKNFDRDRPRFYNNGYSSSQFDRFNRGESGGNNGYNNGNNGFYQDRRRPAYRMNNRPSSYNGYQGSPSMGRRWSNGDDPLNHLNQQRNGNYYSGNGSQSRYSDGGNGRDSGGSNGYEGGSSETQSEPEERQHPQQPVQSILIDNDQYTKIETPRQEVIFKKNITFNTGQSGTSGGGPGSVVPQTATTQQKISSAAKKSDFPKGLNNSSRSNKKNKFDASKSKRDVGKKQATTFDSSKESAEYTAGKKAVQTTEILQRDHKDGGKENDKFAVGPERKPLVAQAGDSSNSMRGEQPIGGNEVRDDYEDCIESEDDEDMCRECDDYQCHLQGMTNMNGGYSPAPQDAPPLAGMIMQQCYPGGPMVSIPVHWTAFLDPMLIPGDTALTPLDPSFTHLLDPSFKPLATQPWQGMNGEPLQPGAIPAPMYIPQNVMPMQQDSNGCPVTVQVKVDQNGTPIQISPSGFTVQLAGLGHPPSHHHPSCQMAGLDPMAAHHYTPYNDPAAHRGQHFEYTFDEGLEKRLEQKIDEELARHYSDEEDHEEEEEEKKVLKKKAQQDEESDSRECEETSSDSQYASMSERSSLPTSPAGELSDSPTSCPPNTPSNTCAPHDSSAALSKSRAQDSTSDASNVASSSSSISISSASTLCSSSSSTLGEAEELVSPGDSAPNSVVTTESCALMNGDISAAEQPETIAAAVADAASTPETAVSDEVAATQTTTPDAATNCYIAAGDAASQPAGDGMTVTVKPGYVMVPILTPYYDPKVLYGYSVMNEAAAERPYLASGKKKKKKHNRRRMLDVSNCGYLDPEMYAGEPYIATPEGYLVPMENPQMYPYPQPPVMPYIHPAQYQQYQGVKQQQMPLHYQHSLDEGFVSVEHTPQLPEYLPEPGNVCSGAGAVYAGDDNSRFGALHEIERQQIQEVLHEAQKKDNSSEEASTAELSDSGVSESEEASTVVSLPNTEAERNLQDPENQSSTSDDISIQNDEVVEKGASEHSQNDCCSVGEDNTESIQASSKESSDPTSELVQIIKSQEQTIISINPNDNLQHLEDHSTNQIFKETEIFFNNEIPEDNLNSEVTDEITEQSLSCGHDEMCVELPDKETAVLDQIYDTVDESNIISHCNSDQYEETVLKEDANKLGESILELKNKSIDPSDSSCESIPIQSQLSNECPDKIFCSSSETEQESAVEKLTDTRSPVDLLSLQVNSAQVENTSDLPVEKGEAISNEIDDDDGTLISTDHNTIEENTMDVAREIADADIAISSAQDNELQESDTLKGLRVTEAVKRWIREVTPEKVFTLSEEVKSMIANRLEDASDQDDEYFEDNVVDLGASGGDSCIKTFNGNVSNKTMSDQNIEEPSKNVKGNPFGALCSDFSRTVNSTKRVASCSTCDVLEDYDGCSTASSLGQEPLYSPAASPTVSQCSSRTITPNRHLGEDDEPEIRLKSVTCDPTGYRKYYQLGVEIDDSPDQTMCQQSPQLPTCTTDPSLSVLPLAAELLKDQSMNLKNNSSIASIPPNCGSPFALDNAPVYFSPSEYSTFSSSSISPHTPISVSSSGIGSSLASSPASSPHRPPRPSLPRLPIFLMPANMRAEDGPISLNTAVPCCTVM